MFHCQYPNVGTNYSVRHCSHRDSMIRDNYPNNIYLLASTVDLCIQASKLKNKIKIISIKKSTTFFFEQHTCLARFSIPAQSSFRFQFRGGTTEFLLFRIHLIGKIIALTDGQLDRLGGRTQRTRICRSISREIVLLMRSVRSDFGPVNSIGIAEKTILFDANGTARYMRKIFQTNFLCKNYDYLKKKNHFAE